MKTTVRTQPILISKTRMGMELAVRVMTMKVPQMKAEKTKARMAMTVTMTVGPRMPVRMVEERAVSQILEDHGTRVLVPD